MRLCWTLTTLLALALAATLYLFLVRGSVAPASDGRTAILLAPAERDLVLTEMRAFLQATQAHRRRRQQGGPARRRGRRPRGRVAARSRRFR